MFELTKSQKEIQKAAAEFAKGKFDKTLCLESNQNHTFPESIWHEAGDLGFIGLHYPESYAGQDLSVFENVLVAETFCKRDSTLGSALALAGYGSECILRFGSEEQKQRYLPEIAEGKMLSSATILDPVNGKDINHIEATAKKIGDHWIIKGRKANVINGDRAGFYCVICRTDLDDKPIQDFVMLLVENNNSGISTSTRSETFGLRMTCFSDVVFEDTRVPVSNQVGKLSQGDKQLNVFQYESRIMLAAIALGTAQGAFDRSLSYVKERRQFKKKIIHFNSIQHKLAELATQIEQARYMTYASAKNADSSKRNYGLGAMAKLTACRTAMNVANSAIQLLGGYGYTSEYEVERFYRDAKMLSLLDGGHHTLKDTIANAVVGRLSK